MEQETNLEKEILSELKYIHALLEKIANDVDSMESYSRPDYL